MFVLMFYVLHLVFTAAHHITTVLEPVLVPICSMLAWGIVILTGWNLVSATRAGLHNAQKMHQIPCANCRFFTNSYHLKCTIHPTTALSEDAINCRDYEP